MLDSIGKSLFWDGMGKTQKPLSFLGTGKNTASSAQSPSQLDRGKGRSTGGKSKEHRSEKKNLPV